LKYCPGCEAEKPDAEFYRNQAKKDGLSSYCKLCFRGQAEKVRLDKRERYLAFLKTGCVDCGETDVVVLDADHIGEKRYSISKLLHGNFTWQFLERELKTCVVRCANCHRKRTAQQFGNFRLDAQAGEQSQDALAA
jgi:hypothetical protein